MPFRAAVQLSCIMSKKQSEGGRGSVRAWGVLDRTISSSPLALCPPLAGSLKKHLKRRPHRRDGVGRSWPSRQRVGGACECEARTIRASFSDSAPSSRLRRPLQATLPSSLSSVRTAAEAGSRPHAHTQFHSSVPPDVTEGLRLLPAR